MDSQISQLNHLKDPESTRLQGNVHCQRSANQALPWPWGQLKTGLFEHSAPGVRHGVEKIRHSVAKICNKKVQKKHPKTVICRWSKVWGEVYLDQKQDKEEVPRDAAYDSVLLPLELSCQLQVIACSRCNWMPKFPLKSDFKIIQTRLHSGWMPEAEAAARIWTWHPWHADACCIKMDARAAPRLQPLRIRSPSLCSLPTSADNSGTIG